MVRESAPFSKRRKPLWQSALRAAVKSIGAEKRQCFSPATAFGAPKSGPKTLQIPGAAILTLPRPCEATNRPTGANTGLHLYLWRRPRLLLKLSGKIAQTHAVLLLAERLHFPSQYLLLGSIQVIAPVLL